MPIVRLAHVKPARVHWFVNISWLPSGPTESNNRLSPHPLPYNVLLYLYLQTRCLDLPEDMISSHEFVKMILCVRGPKQPKCMDGILDALGKNLAQMAEGKSLIG